MTTKTQKFKGVIYKYYTAFMKNGVVVYPDKPYIEGTIDQTIECCRLMNDIICKMLTIFGIKVDPSITQFIEAFLCSKERHNIMNIVRAIWLSYTHLSDKEKILLDGYKPFNYIHFRECKNIHDFQYKLLEMFEFALNYNKHSCIFMVDSLIQVLTLS